jgi:predicted nucleic acid-binding protein
VILDSNVVIALFQSEQPTLFEKLAEWQALHPVHINLVIYAEVAPSFVDPQGLRSALGRLGVEVSGITLEEAFRAGKAFADYRRRGGRRKTILPDFLIGAQAEVRGWPLVTRDRKGFASYFPQLEIIDPFEGMP